LYKVEVLKTIDKIGKESIDSLSDDGFFTYGWFKTLEASKPFKITPTYFVVYERGEIVAIAPCFIEYSSQYFTLQDLSPLTIGLRIVSNRLGSSLTPPLICHSPCSFHSRILLKKGYDERIILDLISNKIDEVCKKQRILFSSFFFVSEFDGFLLENLPNFGYFKIPFFKTAYLDIKWTSFDDYLASFSHEVRKKIRKEIKENRKSGVIIEQKLDFRSLSPIISNLYSNLFLKHTGRRSPFNPLFFEKLSEYAKGKARVFIAEKEGRIVGFSLCLGHGKILDVYIAGFDYSRLTKTDFTYFNVVYYAPIRAAIEEGIKKIHFRTSELELKTKRGCKLEKMYVFVKCHSKILNLFRYLIFFPISFIGLPSIQESINAVVKNLGSLEEAKEKEPVSTALRAKEKSHWFVLQPDGKLIAVDKFNFSEHKTLEKLTKYETFKVGSLQQVPPHLTLMRKLEIANYEPESDLGNLRWYPKGRLMKSLIEEFVTEKVIAYGATEVEAPSLSDYPNRFPARQHFIKSEDKESFLRFSCTDLDQAKDEFLRRFKLCIEILKGLGLSRDDYELAIRSTKDLYQQNKEFIVSLVQLFGKPALVEMKDERFFLKWEFSFVDSLDRASALSTDQIDIENAERYDLAYTDEKDKQQHPLVLNCSPSGAIESDIYAILEKACPENNRGKPPMLPLWLSPTQARVIPISEYFYEYAGKLAERIESNKIRVDFDDRAFTMSRKVREAEMEWIPYVVVIGKKEVESDTLMVRKRDIGKVGESGKLRIMKLEDLVNEIKSKTDGRPFKPLALSKNLSKRSRFSVSFQKMEN
jgi:threonyl-tRNA synthetase